MTSLSATLNWLPEGYCEHAPPAHVAHAVECVWTSVSGRAQSVPVDPDGCVDVVIRYAASARAARRTPSVSIVGAMSQTEIVSVNADDVHIGVRFRPGYGSQLVHVPVDQFTDRVISLCGSSPFNAEAVLRAVGRVEHPSVLAPVLSSLLIPSPREPDAVQRGIDLMVRSHGLLALSASSDMAHLGERQFRRACLARAGLSPKRLSRVLRLRQLIATLRAAPSASMSTLAATNGYSDQAHMIRDVRQLTGRTPATLLGVGHA